MATRAQFRHEDVATVPRGWKVRTKTQASGHQVRIAYPPGPRRRGAGRLISILHPEGENPGKCAEGSPALRGPGVRERLKAEGSNPRGKTKTREQVEKMQAKAVKFLRDVVGNEDKADEIEALSLDDYAAKKKITLGNPKKSKVESRKSKVKSVPEKHKKRVQEMLAKMPKAIRDVFDRNPDKPPVGLLRPYLEELVGKEEAARVSKAVIEKARELRSRKSSKRRRRNQAQDAKALYQKFHGKPPKEVLELQESAAIRGEYTALGDLVELVVKSPAGDSLRIGFAGEKVKLASSPNGGQLYFLGGNQALDGNLARFKTDATKDLVDLGEAQSIVYRAAKDFTGFKSSDWEHAFGEESGERPSAFYDKLKRRIFLVGGTYRVERPGIVD